MNDNPAQPLVSLTVTASVPTSCFAVEERLPGSLQATNVTGGGVWNPDLGVVRWGGYTGTPATTLTYRVSGPAGSHLLDGTLFVNGDWSITPPSTTVDVGDNSETLPVRPATISAPVFVPAGSTGLPVSVTVTTATVGATIRFTTNGLAPTVAHPVWSGSMLVGTATLFRARAFASNAFPSEVRSAWFGTVQAPPGLAVGRVCGTNGTDGTSVTDTVSGATAGACWAYEAPVPGPLTATNVGAAGVFDATGGVVRWGPFTNAAGSSLVYRVTGPAGTYALDGAWSVDGYSGAGTSSWVTVGGAAEETIPVRPGSLAAPTISPAGSSTLPVLVTVSNANAGGQIRYTLDGTVPGAGAALYTGPLNLTSNTWLRARAFATNAFPSEVRSAWFGQAVAPPGLAVGRACGTNGTDGTAVTDTVTGASAGDCWAYEARVPGPLTATNVGAAGVFDAAGGMVRWGPFANAAGSALVYRVTGPAGDYEIAADWSVNGYGGVATNPAVTVAGAPGEDTVPQPPPRVARPVLSPAGTNRLPVDVAISCATTGATIRFTTNGLSPVASSAEYTGALHLDGSMIVRAAGFKDGYWPSESAAGVYVWSTNYAPMRITRTVTGDGGAVPTITLLVEPPAGARSYSVTEEWMPALSAHADEPLVSSGGTGSVPSAPGGATSVSSAKGANEEKTDGTEPVPPEDKTDDTEVVPPAVGPISSSSETTYPLAVWQAESCTMRWGPFAGDATVQLSYKVTGVSGIYAVRGYGTVDGLEYATGGTGTVEIVRQRETYQTGIRIWLGGPYRAASNAMNAVAGDLLPRASPYAQHAVRAGAIPTGVCDWVLVELREPNGVPYLTKSLFVRTDGWVVDGAGGMGTGVATPVWKYLVAVKHRNHLAVVSSQPVALTNETVTFDFTGDWRQFAGGSNACVEVAPGVWGMAPGDVDGDGKITPVDAEMVRESLGKRGYLNADLDLDGEVTGR